MESTYKSSTFLASLFYKFHIRDAEIRKQVTAIFEPLVASILRDAPADKRILIFKGLLPLIQKIIIYLEFLQTSVLDERHKMLIIQVLLQAFGFSTYLIDKVGINSASPSTFSQIMSQVNIDELTCNIGDCLIELRQLSDNTEKDNKDALSHLEVLLMDFNQVTQQSLTIAEVLGSLESVKDEL